jgi:hypothetical protein
MGLGVFASSKLVFLPLFGLRSSSSSSAGGVEGLRALEGVSARGSNAVGGEGVFDSRMTVGAMLLFGEI